MSEDKIVAMWKEPETLMVASRSFAAQWSQQTVWHWYAAVQSWETGAIGIWRCALGKSGWELQETLPALPLNSWDSSELADHNQ